MTAGGSSTGVRTTIDRLAAYGGLAALTSGILAALAAASLLLLAVLEAPARLRSGATDPSSFVRLNDAFGGLAMLAAIPVAARLHQSWRGRAAAASTAVLRAGVGSLIGYAVVVLSYAGGLNRPTVQGPLTVVGLGGIGLWILLATLGRADPALGGGLRLVGLAIGAGNLLLFVAYFDGGGTAAITDQQLGPRSALLLAAYAAGTLSSQIGYPIWAVWLGRRWSAGTSAA